MRFYETRNDGVDATAMWRAMVLAALAKALVSGSNIGPKVINEVVNFPGGRITDVGQAVVDYLNYRLFSVGPEPEWLRLLLDEQGKSGELTHPNEAELG